ncbi:MAG: tape measure protein [Xenococcus sp. MO_188.B8]|nr:tape measure protein [Xenococcus sp. MO_188.B8]
MATKTLGVKFQVAGVKEAQASLNKLRNSLNQSLKNNKEAVATSLKLSERLKNSFNFRRSSPIPNEPNQPTDSRETANNIVRLDRYSIDEIAKKLGQGGGGNSDLPDPVGTIRRKGIIGGTVANLGFSARSIYKGFLESIGSGLGSDFGEGLKKGLQEDLDLSFNRRGEVAGKTISYGVAEGGRGLWDGFKNFMDSINNAKVRRENPEQARDDVDTVSKALVKLVTVLPSKLATGYRRSAVQLEGLPRVDKLKKRPENQGNQFKDTTDHVVYTFSGFGGQEGKGGYKLAEMLAEHADELTEIVGMENRFTDLSTNYKKTTQWVIEALGTIAAINVKGFNPDAIKGSAQIINDLDANPNIKATILGHSAGGFPSEEITQILNLLGYGDRIRGISAGTPNLKGRIDPDNFIRVMGDGDNKMRNLEKAVDPIGFVENDADILEGVGDHFFEDYLESEEFLEIVLGNRISGLLKRYQKYLENLAKSSQNLANKRINTLLPGYKNFTLDQKKTSAEDLSKYLKTIISKRYRQAVKENDLNLAKELGENLIRQIQFLRKIYGDIIDEGGVDPSISSKLGNLTKIQQEVISGQPNLEGYDSKGLVNHFGDQLSGEAGYVVDGFVEGIKNQLDRVKDVGDEIGENLQDGTDENLGIASPAKRFIKKGYEVVKGFIIGIKNEFGEVRNTGSDLGDELSDGAGESTNKFKSFFSQIGDRFPLLKKFKGLIGGIATLFLGGLGIRFAINLINQLGKEALATALELEKVDKAIIFISRNPIEGLGNLNFISQQAKALSVDLKQAKEAYAGLLGAAKNTPLEGVQTQRLFSAFAAAAVNRGVDAQGQSRLFTALEQIVSKRKLGAEEVVQQIGDISGFGDFKNLVQESMGVSSAELDQMMRQGEVGIDVLPKVVALIEAQNASADGTQTAQQALTKYNNSLLEFKGTLGSILQPLEKFKLNVLSAGLDFISEKLELIFTLIGITGGVALLAMFGQVNMLTLAKTALGNSINFVTASLQKLWAAKFALIAGLLKLAGAYALVTGAYLAWKNVIDLFENQYQDIEDGADKMAAGIDRYRQAIEAATNSQAKFNQSQQKLKLNEGLELKGWFQNLQGVAGGDRLNFDNLIRKRLDWVYDRPGGQFLQYGPAALFIKGSRGNFTTEAERRDADRKVATGKVSFRTNQLLTESQGAFTAADKINEFDRQIRAIQAQRLELLPGDKEALEASLEAEREIAQERDKYLKILTTYQQELQNAIAQNKKVLENPDLADLERTRAQNELDATQKVLNRINGEISRVTKALSEFEKRLRNSSERINNFIERRGLEAQAERSQIITEGLELGKGDRTIQLELEQASRRELNDYIAELEKTIDQGRKRLESGALADGYRLVQESAETNNLTLDTDTINRMLSKDRDQAQKDALLELKELRENRTKLNQYREQLAQNLQTNRNSLIDFNRTINDYFFRITQQIKEAQLETERLLSQIFYTDIKNKLRSAIAPGSNTFVNGIIDNIQSVIDQASQVAQKVFGDRAASLGFESESRSLFTEMQDFIRQIGNAGDAVQLFTQRLNGSKPAPNLSENPSAGDNLTAQSNYW